MKYRILALLAGLVFAVAASGCFFNVTSYQDKDGSTVYVGEVQNDGPPLENPEVTGTFLDANGNVITTGTGFVCRVMPTKSVSAFKLRLPAGSAPAARVEWKLSGTEVANPYLAEGLTGKLLGDGPALPPSGASHFGEARNNSTTAYNGAYGCVAWLNAKGEVIREARISGAGLRFNPGAVIPFVAYEDVPADAVDTIFFLDAGVPNPLQPAFTVIDVPLSAYMHSSTQLGPGAPLSFGFGELHNTGSTPIFPMLIATTHDAAGVLNGVGNTRGICGVPAAPGGFTYAGYAFTSSAPAGTKPDIRIEANVLDRPLSVTALTVSGVSGVQSAHSARVTGTVKNTSTQTMETVEACGAAYDASGHVVSVAEDFVSTPAGGLAPGATASFSVDVPLLGSATTFNAVAGGSPPAPPH